MTVKGIKNKNNMTLIIITKQNFTNEIKIEQFILNCLNLKFVALRITDSLEVSKQRAVEAFRINIIQIFLFQ